MIRINLFHLLVTSALAISVISTPAKAQDSSVEINTDLLDTIISSTPPKAPSPATSTDTAPQQTQPIDQQGLNQTIEVSQVEIDSTTAPAKADLAPLVETPKPSKLSKKQTLSQPANKDIKIIRGAPPPFNMWDAVWVGRANIGANRTSGNSNTKGLDFDLFAEAKWQNNDRFEIKLRNAFEEAEDKTVTDQRSLSTNFNDFITDNLFLDYNLLAEKDDIQGIDMRIATGINLGHQVFDHKRLKLRYSIGPAFVLEELDGTSGSEKKVNYNWRMNFERSLKDNAATFYHNNQLLVPASGKDEYVLKTSSGVRIPMNNKINVSFNVDHNVDQGVPKDKKDTDTRYGFKLGYEWK